MEESTGNLFSSPGSGTPAKARFLCRTSDIRPVDAKLSYSGKWWEWQANRAIGGLLLPRQLVRKSLSSLIEESEFGPSLADSKRSAAERHVAETFDVNPVVARIRLAEMFPRTKQAEF
jgi:hypothetical protein